MSHQKLTYQNPLQPLPEATFGSVYKDRAFEGFKDYKYSFNSKEKDDEVKGKNDEIDFGARGYDPRTGKFMSEDPIANKHPSQSPYNAMDNNPILENDPTGESGEVTIDKETKTLTVTSKITLYGGGANKFLATTTAMDVQNTWNKAAGKVTLDGVSYNVKFVVTGEYKQDAGTLKKEIESNTDIKNNYYRVEKGTDEYWTGTSYTDEQGANTGYFDRSQIADNNSTTEGHEIGHGFGLDHDTNPDGKEGTDYRGKGEPHVMLTVFDAVDKKYQGTSGDLDPNKRVAKQENINKLGLDKLKFDKNGKADLGKTTNVYHER